MPIQENNMIMRSTRGMIGKQVVFKERDGDTYVSAPPRRRKKGEPDAEELARREKFTKSVAYGSAAMKNAETKKMYAARAKRKQTAYNVAFNDAYSAPEVVSIIAANYKGVPGDSVVVFAKDDFKVNSVKVSILNAAGEVVETGDAVLNTDNVNWIYTATQANAQFAGGKITATAFDLPENSGSLEVNL